MRPPIVRPLRNLGVVSSLILAALPAAAADISLTAPLVTHTESFNTLANSGTTSSSLPTGWVFNETGAGANTTYRVGDGSSNQADTYSFGSTASTDRAFGTLASIALTPTIGASFRNDTGVDLSGVTITFTGEQWRRGNGSAPDRLDFSFSTDATSLTTGTWTDVNALDFTSQVAGSPNNTALDGNAAANSAVVSGSVTFAAPLAPGDSFIIRWLDFNSTGSEDGLAIDDFAITAMPVPVPEPTTLLGISAAGLGLGAWMRRRLRSRNRK